MTDKHAGSTEPEPYTKHAAVVHRVMALRQDFLSARRCVFIKISG
jgi:hypothetical protein